MCQPKLYLFTICCLGVPLVIFETNKGVNYFVRHKLHHALKKVGNHWLVESGVNACSKKWRNSLRLWIWVSLFVTAAAVRWCEWMRKKCAVCLLVPSRTKYSDVICVCVCVFVSEWLCVFVCVWVWVCVFVRKREIVREWVYLHCYLIFRHAFMVSCKLPRQSGRQAAAGGT